MKITITRDLLDSERELTAFYQGIEAGAGKKIAGIKQKGLSLMIEFEPCE